MKRGTLLFGLGTAALGAVVAIAGSRGSTREPAAAAPVVASAAARSKPLSAMTSVHAAAAAVARNPTLSPPAPAPGLDADLSDQDARVRRAAIREAARDPDLDPAILISAMRDRDQEVSITATIAVGKRYADGAVPVAPLIAAATDRALDERVRVSALNAIGLVPSTEGATLLVDLVAHGSPSERASAAILLVHQDAEVAVPALIAALTDSEDFVRANALEALRGRARGRDFGKDAAAWHSWWQARPR